PFRPSKAIKQRPLTEQAKVEGKKISPERVRNLLMALSAIFTIAVENQWITSNPVRELPKRKRQRTNSDDKPFTKSEISQIFSTPLFQGEASPHGAMAYWIPLILYYTGARVEEIAQLYKKNITVENGLHCLKIQMKDDQSVKDGLSRLVPLCDHLIELGFLDYANSREHHLFTEEKNPAGKYSYNFLRWFGNYIRKHGVTRKEVKPTHSFRHTFASYCRDNGTREDMQNSILGHSLTSVSRSYGIYSVESKKTEIEKIPRLDLQRLDIWTGRAN
ncbi:TPA: site-specific integrase, partial [Serratia fonticola]